MKNQKAMQRGHIFKVTHHGITIPQTPSGSLFVNVKFMLGLALLIGIVLPWILSHQPAKYLREAINITLKKKSYGIWFDLEKKSIGTNGKSSYNWVGTGMFSSFPNLYPASSKPKLKKYGTVNSKKPWNFMRADWHNIWRAALKVNSKIHKLLR